MGIDLVYVGDGRESRTRFSMAEWDTLQQVEPLLPEAMATVVGDAELGETVSVPLNGLRAAIAQVIGLLSSQGNLLPFTYTFKAEYLLLNGQRFPFDDEFVTGMRSGLELPGDPGHRYAIHAGLDECWLTKLAVGPDGRGRVVERRDLRSDQEIHTVTCGRIRIQKRRDHAGLRAEFAKISEFLESLAGPEVTRIVG
jgi:hypothetical protein